MKICISIKKTPQRYWANDFVRQMHGMFCTSDAWYVLCTKDSNSYYKQSL